MLSIRESLVRFLIAVVLFLLSVTGTVTGNIATICGVLATIELATALLRYSPLMEAAENFPRLRYILKLGMIAHKH